MANYAEFQIGNLSASEANDVSERLRQLRGPEVLVTTYNRLTRTLQVGAGGADLSRFLESVRTETQDRVGRAPDMERAAADSRDMRADTRCITGGDRVAGVSK